MTKYGERLLKSQGWRGKGHTLHPTDNAIGLSNPLRISRNTDGRGIGGSTHYTSDQWWLSAFDEKLKGLDTSKSGQVTQTTTQSKLDSVTANIGGGKYTGAGGLYASFVRGEGLAGSVAENAESEKSGASTPGSGGGSDKEGVPGLKGGVVKSRKRLEKEARKRQEKEEKKRRKAMEKLKRKEEKRAAKKAAKAVTREEEKKKRKEGETKEERKARKLERRAKKEEKRRRRAEKEKKP